MNLPDIASRFQGVRWSGEDRFAARCPRHDDLNSSLSVGRGDKGIVLKCFAGCQTDNILSAIDLKFSDLFFNGNGISPYAAQPVIASVYSYQDATGAEVFQICRYNPKTFRPRRSDGNGGHVWNLDGVPRVLYRLPELLKADTNTDVFVTEGEKDCDNLRALGLTATCNPFGAGKWRPEYNEHLKGRHVVIPPDHDEPGMKHAQDVARHLHGIAASIKIVPLFDGPVSAKHGQDVSDYLADHDVEDLSRLIEAASVWTSTPTALVDPVPLADAPTPTTPTTDLAGVVKAFQHWLYLPDPIPLYATFAVIAANRRQGDPVWMQIIAPSSRGKTEIIGSVRGLPNVHPAATITEAALLSGTPKREKAQDSKGGLLRQIGDFGIIVLKDFGSVLSMGRDARASVLAALREVFDGSWTRQVGTDGGRTLHWEGKVGMLAGCTPAIDSHHGVMAALGERFIFCRLAEKADDREDHDDQLARRALKHIGQEKIMRRELAEAVSGLFAGVQIDAAVPDMTSDEIDRLVALTTLVVRCRSTVERDPYNKEIESIPGAESPGRLARVAASLLGGLHVIGIDRPTAWKCIERVLLDSMPAIRLSVLDAVLKAGGTVQTKSLATSVSLPTTTARRQLEALAAYDVIDRDGSTGKPDEWTISTWARGQIGKSKASHFCQGRTLGEGP
jgi:hypothetical protein